MRESAANQLLRTKVFWAQPTACLEFLIINCVLESQCEHSHFQHQYKQHCYLVQITNTHLQYACMRYMYIQRPCVHVFLMCGC